MKCDLYTKTLLTVIAGLLALNIIWNLTPVVHAQRDARVQKIRLISGQLREPNDRAITGDVKAVACLPSDGCYVILQ
jgi:hypothetical protein